MPKPVEFNPPAGFSPPEGVSDATFESMATFRVKPNGRFCLVAIGDHKMPGYDKDKESTYRDEGGEVASKYHNAMA